MFLEDCYCNAYLKTETFYFVLLRLIRLSFLRLSKERFSQTKNFPLLLPTWLVALLMIEVEHVMKISTSKK